MSMQTPGTVTTGAPPTTGGQRSGSARDRYLDFLRFLAICRVVVYHAYGFVWLTYVFPAMGVMFALGGSLMANSLKKPGGHPVRNRTRRLLPALWVLGAVIVPVMITHAVRAGTTDELPSVGSLLAWILPVVSPPGTDFVLPVTEVLWYITAYLWFVALSPLAIRAYRRWPLPTVLAPLVILAIVAFSGLDLEVSNAFAVAAVNLATFGSCWLAGFAHRDGRLDKVRLPVLLGVAATALVAGTVWAFVRMDDYESLDLNNNPLAQGLYSFGFVLIAMRLRPGIEWLRQRRVLDGLVTFVNARAVTIYLWHNPAIDVSYPIGDRLNVWRFGATVGGVLCMVVAVVLVAAMTLAVGWVEDLAARRPPRLIPRRAGSIGPVHG
jgi:peptidoglycan/LPS O-acetylase OafA/YrhL